jgi:hypothetical protein
VGRHQAPEVGLLEWSLADKKFKQNASQGVDIRARVHAAAKALFRGAVAKQGSGQLLARCHLANAGEKVASHPKFEESDRDQMRGLAGRQQEYVFRSQAEIEQASLMCGAHRCRGLRNEITDCSQIRGKLALSLQPLGEAFGLDVLANQVDSSIGQAVTVQEVNEPRVAKI